MKKMLVAAIASVAAISLIQSPAIAEIEPIKSHSYCVIPKQHDIVLSAVRMATLSQPPISFTVGQIRCPGNIKLSQANYLARGITWSLEDGEWAMAQNGYPNGGYNGLSLYVTMNQNGWTVDPQTGLATQGTMGDGNWSSDIPAADDAEMKFSIPANNFPMGRFNVVSGVVAWHYSSVVYKKNGIVTRYPLKFESDVVAKYESTVSLKSKAHGKTLWVTAHTSRNRPTRFYDPQATVLKAYRNDHATLYRDGKKVKVKKVSRNGKVVFYVKKTKKQHVYEVRIPANAINFAGSASITK